MEYLKILFTRATILASIGQFTDGPAASEYTVEGYLKYQALAGTSYAEEYRFTVTVSNCLWAIEMRPLGDPKKASYALTSRCTQFFDGKTLTCKLYWTAAIRGQNGVMFVEESDVPSSVLQGFAANIWLAYASGCYLHGITNGHLKPTWLLDTNRRANGFTAPAQWDTYPQKMGLPVFVKYYFDQSAWNASKERSTYHRPIQSIGDSRAILWASYETGGNTNVSGISLPLEFTFTGFEAYKELAKPGNRLAVTRITGKTESVKPKIEDRLFDATFLGIAAVDDVRLLGARRENGINYRLTNAAPPATDDKMLSLLRARQEFLDSLAGKHFHQKTKGTRITFLVLTLFVTTIFAVILVKARQQSKSTERTVT